MDLTVLKSLVVTNLLIFTFASCANNGLKVSSHYRDWGIELCYEPASSICAGIDQETKEVFLLDSRGIRCVSSLPKEFENLKLGRMTFVEGKVNMVVVSFYSRFDLATNDVVEKKDVSRFVFDTLVKVNGRNGSNEKYMGGIRPEEYVVRDDFSFDRSYIVGVVRGNKKEFVVYSVYNAEEEDLERNVVSAWEGVCWDKGLSLNITEKFIVIIISNYNAIKRAGKWEK